VARADHPFLGVRGSGQAIERSVRQVKTTGEAARILGLGGQATTLFGRAGLVHDLERLGVPDTICGKHGSLSHAETERMRLHPYRTERTLACWPAGRDHRAAR
jgi:HD-GYP domain-containing protein (c-di-GMP phosphodiesterase class II)